MSTETVPVQEEAATEVVEPVIEQEPVEAPEPEQKEEHVPLSALQKERRKRQEIEQELRWHKEQMMARKPEPAPEPDDSLYEAATKEDLGKVRQQIVKEVQEANRAKEEASWIKHNPEKAAEINERLSDFLKQRPNLASAIEGAQNRYEEAWELMDKLTPRQKASLKPSPARKEAPGNPAAIPKGAALNEALNFSAMTDAEFNAWRKSQRKPR